jgi:hypothetical protein
MSGIAADGDDFRLGCEASVGASMTARFPWINEIRAVIDRAYNRFKEWLRDHFSADEWLVNYNKVRRLRALY